MPLFPTSNTSYLDVSSLPGVTIDLKYATNDNFTGENLYGSFKTCLLHTDAAQKLRLAAKLLQSSHPGYSLLIYDGLRPLAVQRQLWERVKGSPWQDYVTDPKIGSMHNYGLAVDLTVTDASGLPLDMGAGFDDFREISQPRYEAKFLASGELHENQVTNRLILRAAMTKAGFIQLMHEWWHYDAFPQASVSQHYSIVE